MVMMAGLKVAIVVVFAVFVAVYGLWMNSVGKLAFSGEDSRAVVTAFNRKSEDKYADVDYELEITEPSKFKGEKFSEISNTSDHRLGDVIKVGYKGYSQGRIADVPVERNKFFAGVLVGVMIAALASHKGLRAKIFDMIADK